MARFENLTYRTGTVSIPVPAIPLLLSGPPGGCEMLGVRWAAITGECHHSVLHHQNTTGFQDQRALGQQIKPCHLSADTCV
jgi:hypothetical protein